ncbi:LysR substrate-binding domain-containing protein [Amycolatopsis jiangsuensis]|uniref:DNA-binding transcriptional LysR family regulator n=1 Tax=Amycolatopsis jiangsuensis TaxID=1181879 RepID=A0A840J759_9PSEU|nr:LysR substrate-binding domain-containing protein [Amycolatopsis jiangsuensis]MBB4689272.1 DNA-binding transcriptional LysR family regulator [Amycolatopsis jiangsuensis]
MNIDFALLRSFVVLAEELHFARAAERLYIEQPALSQRLRRLERRIEVQLFDRDTRNVRLTPAGVEFLEDIRDVLDRFDGAVARAQETASGERGSFRVAYTFSVGYETLPVLLAGLDVDSGLQAEALELWEYDVLDAVRRRRQDVGLVRYDPADRQLVSVLIRRERLVIAVPHGHRLANAETVSLSRLSGEQFVIIPRTVAPGYHEVIEQVFARAGFAPRTVTNAVPGSRVMADLPRNNAVALLPASVQRVHPDGVAAFLTVEEEFAHLPVRLIHRADASVAVRAFADRAQQIARTQGWL